jgi:hypothetical protein
LRPEDDFGIGHMPPEFLRVLDCPSFGIAHAPSASLRSACSAPPP